MNIALVGPRGSGKTRISLHLGLLLKRPILSLDTMISYEEGGKSIPDLIAEHDGDWRHFRDVEYRVLAKAAAAENVIIDCGGGIVVDLDERRKEVFSERKAAVLRERALVFFLNVPLDLVSTEIAGAGDRPSLGSESSPEEIFHHRLPMYRQVANHEISVAKGKRKSAAKEICKIVAASE